MNPDSKWLQPLSKCNVEPRYSKVKVSGVNYSSLRSSPVVWNLDVYMIRFVQGITNAYCQLFKYSTTNESWSNFMITCHGHHRQVHVHVLVVYRSKLLMIDEDGGDIKEFDNTFKKSHDIGRLLTHSGKVVAAVSEGKYLLVVCQRKNTTWTSIAVFDGNDWFFRSGPYLYHDVNEMVQVIIHNSTLLLAEHKHSSVPIIHMTPLQALLDGATSVWQLFDGALPVLANSFHVISNLAVFNSRLHIASRHQHCSDIVLWCYSESGCIEVGRGTVSDQWLSNIMFLFPSQIHDGSVMLVIGRELTPFKLVPQGTIYVDYFKICVCITTLCCSCSL